MNVCKGICKLDFETRSMFGRTYPSFETWPKCTSCEVRINFNGKNCPCCGVNLKTRTDEGNKHSRNFTRQFLSNKQLKIKKSSLKEKKS